jgi:adenosine deaminase
VPSTPPSVRDLRALPKAHLHVHLEGAMRADTLTALAAAYGVSVPPPRARYGTFADFADLYMAATGVLRSAEDLRHLVDEVVEDAARQGVVWIEPAFHPPHHPDLGTPRQVLEQVIEQGAASGATHGVGVGWLVAANRTAPVADAVELAEVAGEYAGRGVVAFGLANDEAASPPEWFADAFDVARAAGLRSAPHAGEYRGADSVSGALDTLGAHRVQHGVRAVEDDVLLRRLADGRTCLDVCLTSNAALSVVADIRDHPLPRLLELGVPCTINADDPLLFDVDLVDEYETCRNILGLDDGQLAACARTSIEFSGAPEELQRSALAGVDVWLGSPAQD